MATKLQKMGIDYQVLDNQYFNNKKNSNRQK
jgi:hypothetical protein